MELKSVAGLVQSNGLGIKNKLDALSLIFVKFTTFEFLFAFLLKCYDDKANKNIYHKKSYHDYINDVVYSSQWAIV